MRGDNELIDAMAVVDNFDIKHEQKLEQSTGGSASEDIVCQDCAIHF